MIHDDAVMYLEALANAATTLSTGCIATMMGDTDRAARRRVELLARAGLIERVQQRGFRANAFGVAAAGRGES